MRKQVCGEGLLQLRGQSSGQDHTRGHDGGSPQADDRADRGPEVRPRGAGHHGPQLLDTPSHRGSGADRGQPDGGRIAGSEAALVTGLDARGAASGGVEIGMALCSSPEKKGKIGQQSVGRPIEDKKTFRWLEGHENTVEVAKKAPETRLLVVMDRARELSMPPATLYRWVYRGWIKVQRSQDGRRILWADSNELARLRELRSVPRGHHNRRRRMERTKAMSTKRAKGKPR